jgi:hypothetical protein
MNDHVRSEQMHQSWRNSKKEKLGTNSSGMFRTNAQDIVVTEKQQNRKKNPGMNLSGRPEQAQKSLLLSRRNSKKENTQG